MICGSVCSVCSLKRFSFSSLEKKSVQRAYVGRSSFSVFRVGMTGVPGSRLSKEESHLEDFFLFSNLKVALEQIA